jgi:WD40 repeat protein
LWDIATGKVRTFSLADSPQSVVFSPDGRWLVAGTGAKSKPGGANQIARGEFTIYDVATLESRLAFKDFPGPVCALAFSPDGKLFATGATGGIVKFWNVADLLRFEPAGN